MELLVSLGVVCGPHGGRGGGALPGTGGAGLAGNLDDIFSTHYLKGK